MHIPDMTRMLPILQTAIGPVILISGVGLLLLTMTNRLGRVIDRTRVMAAEFVKAGASGQSSLSGRSPAQSKVKAQLDILWRRAKLIRMAISLTAFSALSSAFLVIAIFFAALFELDIAGLIAILFCVSLGALIGALIFFIRDINLTLAALKLELEADHIDIR